MHSQKLKPWSQTELYHQPAHKIHQGISLVDANIWVRGLGHKQGDIKDDWGHGDGVL